MTAPGATQREEILARLAQSRSEIARLLEPSEPGDGAGSHSGTPGGGFPRSRTMQALMSGRGLGAMGAVASGLFIARPGMAFRLLKLLPTGAVGRMVMGRVLGAMRRRR